MDYRLILTFHFSIEQVGEKSIIDAINEEQLAKIQSLTKELEETDKLETAASSSSSSNEKKDKIAAEGDVKGGDLKLGNQVLSATGEHYLKTDDKDITSFQENDTVSAHSKVTCCFCELSSITLDYSIVRIKIKSRKRAVDISSRADTGIFSRL